MLPAGVVVSFKFSVLDYMNTKSHCECASCEFLFVPRLFACHERLLHCAAEVLDSANVFFCLSFSVFFFVWYAYDICLSSFACFLLVFFLLFVVHNKRWQWVKCAVAACYISSFMVPSFQYTALPSQSNHKKCFLSLKNSFSLDEHKRHFPLNWGQCVE